VTVEKAPRHIVDRNIKSSPHRGRFIVSSSAAMYLEKKEIFKFHNHNNNTNFDSITFMTAPFYLLVVTYAVVKLFLHVTE
jgi:hypothetical protein